MTPSVTLTESMSICHDEGTGMAVASNPRDAGLEFPVLTDCGRAGHRMRPDDVRVRRTVGCSISTASSRMVFDGMENHAGRIVAR